MTTVFSLSLPLIYIIVFATFGRRDIRGCLFNKLISSFLPHLSFNWRIFFRRIIVACDVSEQKLKYGPVRTLEIADIRLLDELHVKTVMASCNPKKCCKGYDVITLAKRTLNLTTISGNTLFGQICFQKPKLFV